MTGRFEDAPPGEERVGFRIDYAMPSPDLADSLGGFHGYHIFIGPGVEHDEIFLPAWGSVRITTSPNDWTYAVGGRRYDPVPKAALFGPSSESGVARVLTGHMVGVYVLPRIWSRIVPVSASDAANRLLPLEEIWGDDARDLVAMIAGSPDIESQKAAFEAIIRRRLENARPEPEGAAAIEAMLLDPEIRTVDEATARLGWPEWKFARFVRKHFGFTPKVLMRRARFMRTILPLQTQTAAAWSEKIDDAYTDQSHFIRDCHDFLGMTPGQFMARFQPIASAAFSERERVLGKQHHLLSDPD
jgi:AraC-like DNA-binding protein